MAESSKDVEKGPKDIPRKSVDTKLVAASQQEATDILPLPPKYGDSHISASHANIERKNRFAILSNISLEDEPSFFAELVSACDGTWDLPFVYPVRWVWDVEVKKEQKIDSSGGNDEVLQEVEDLESVKLPLYVTESEHGKLLETSLNHLGGATLSVRKLLDMDDYYLQAQFRHEYAKILRMKSVDRNQMVHIRELFAHWSTIEKLRLKLDTEENSLLSLRLALGKVVQKDEAEEDQVQEMPKRSPTQLTADALQAVEESKAVHRLQALARFFHLDHEMGRETLDEYMEYASEIRRIEKFERHRVGFLRRLFTALIGGLMFVIPVLVMTLNPSLNKSLITTCVAVIIFSLYMTLATSSLRQTELLGASAAYAAVLAVFIGTGLTSPSG